MSTEDRLAALEESLQLVIQGVRALNEHRLVLQESFRLMAEQMERLVEHQAETSSKECGRCMNTKGWWRSRFDKLLHSWSSIRRKLTK
jgi:hypothetical protein